MVEAYIMYVYVIENSRFSVVLTSNLTLYHYIPTHVPTGLIANMKPRVFP